MRTTLNLPTGLLDDTVALAHGTKTEVVSTALREYKHSLLRRKLLDLRGKASLIDDHFDIEKLRDKEMREV